MGRSMANPNYVYRPRSSDVRARQSVDQRRRMGIPDGHVQVYGVHVPEAHADPLRSYAYEVARRWNADAAKQFILKAAANDWEVEKPPVPIRLRKFGPVLPPREFVRIECQRRAIRSISRFAHHWQREFLRDQRIAEREARRLERLRPIVVRSVARFARHWELAEAREQRMLLRVCRVVARFARHWERRQRIDWELVEELLSETANIGEVARFLNVTEGHVKNSLRLRHDQGLSIFGRRVRRA